MLKKIIDRMCYDKYAATYAWIGLVCTDIGVGIALEFFREPWSIITASLFSGMILGYIYDIIRRLYNAVNWNTMHWIGYVGPHQPSYKETIMMIVQMWLFLVVFLVRLINNRSIDPFL